MGMYMKSFLSYLNQTADLLPDKLAFSDGEQGLTFRELRQAVAADPREKGVPSSKGVI